MFGMEKDANKTHFFSGRAEDWDDWKMNFRGQMGRIKLLTAMDGNREASNLDDIEWAEAQRTVYYHIASSVRKEAKAAVGRVEEGDGHGAWSALVKRYESKNQSRILGFANKLMTSRYHESQDIRDFVTMMEELRRRYEESSSATNSCLHAICKHFLTPSTQ